MGDGFHVLRNESLDRIARVGRVQVQDEDVPFGGHALLLELALQEVQHGLRGRLRADRIEERGGLEGDGAEDCVGDAPFLGQSKVVPSCCMGRPPDHALLVPQIGAGLVDEPDLLALLHVLDQLQAPLLLLLPQLVHRVLRAPVVLGLEVVDASFLVVVPDGAWVYWFRQVELLVHFDGSFFQTFRRPRLQQLLVDEFVDLRFQEAARPSFVLRPFYAAFLLPARTNSCDRLHVET